MKITVFVTPKKNVLDPQGAAVSHAMGNLGFQGLKKVTIGRVIEMEMDGEDTPEFRESIDRICRELLSNPVIEDYRYELN
ncbi:MAG TPA: phosphoribosylformylglycinamidine synthase subunit PurS [Opitutales bacterium]|nr:phosphoribosylformylglycinamidine synthase subunit PurS [Opitutales bacterium]